MPPNIEKLFKAAFQIEKGEQSANAEELLLYELSAQYTLVTQFKIMQLNILSLTE